MTKYKVDNGVLYSGSKQLGNSEDIIVDGHQDIVEFIKRSNREKVSVAQLPEGDYVMVTPSGLTVGIEEKKSGDLATSLRNRRLQRQLRRLEDAVDIPLLGLRFGYSGSFTPEWWDFFTLSMSVELLKWSLRGGIILLPYNEDELLCTLRRARNILQPGKHLFSIVSGTDKKVKGRSPFHRAVQRMVEGVGPATARKLNTHYNGNMIKLLSDDEEGWTAAGLNSRQRIALGDLTDEN